MKEKCSTIIQWKLVKMLYVCTMCWKLSQLRVWAIVSLCLYNIVPHRRGECAILYVYGIQIRANNEELWQKFFGAHQFTFLIVCILLKCYLYTIFSTLLNILEFLLIVHVCTRNRKRSQGGKAKEVKWK